MLCCIPKQWRAERWSLQAWKVEALQASEASREAWLSRQPCGRVPRGLYRQSWWRLQLVVCRHSHWRHCPFSLLRGLYRQYQWRYQPLSTFAASGNGGFSLAASFNGGLHPRTDPLRYFFWNRPHPVNTF